MDRNIFLLFSATQICIADPSDLNTFNLFPPFSPTQHKNRNLRILPRVPISHNNTAKAQTSLLLEYKLSFIASIESHRKGTCEADCVLIWHFIVMIYSKALPTITTVRLVGFFIIYEPFYFLYLHKFLSSRGQSQRFSRSCFHR